MDIARKPIIVQSCIFWHMAIAPGVRESTRESILDATDRLMARYGFRKMTMDDVAKEAGVSKRTIYTYFRSKEDVGLSSIGRVVGKVVDELAEISQLDIPRAEKLTRMLRRRVLGRIEQVQEYAHSLDELFEAVRPAYMARRAETFGRECSLMAAVVGGPDAQEVAESLILATNAFLPYSLSVRELGSPESVAKKLESMISTLLKGAVGPTTGLTQ